MFVSIKNRVINTKHIETMEAYHGVPGTSTMRIGLVSGRVIHIEEDEAKELVAFMDKHHLVERT